MPLRREFVRLISERIGNISLSRMTQLSRECAYLLSTRSPELNSFIFFRQKLEYNIRVSLFVPTWMYNNANFLSKA